MPKEPVDPYTPPPRHRDRSGGAVRFVILAALLGAAAWGYVTFSQQNMQTASTAPAAQQQVADAGYQVVPATPAAESPATPAQPTPPATPPAEPTTPPA